MEYKKSEITLFAKQCAQSHYQISNSISFAERLVHSDTGQSFVDTTNNNDELLFEIAQRYTKYIKNECTFDFDNAETQVCQDIIIKIIECCDDITGSEKMAKE